MLKDVVGRLRSMNPWHFLWVAVILSEIFTFLMNSLQGYLRHGFVSDELLVIGAIDALFVPIVVAPIIISFIAKTEEMSRARDELTREIGERVKMEGELREERIFTEGALNALQEIFFVIDLEGRFLRWNDTVRKETGYSDAEISVMKPGDFFPLDERPRVAESIASVVEKGHTGLETWLLTKDGRKIPFMFTGSLLSDNEGRKIGISGTGRDVSERRQAETLLRESEAKFRDMAEKTVVGVYLIQDGIFRYINPMLAEIFGYRVEEITNKKGPEHLVFPEDWPIVRDKLSKRIAGQIKSAHYAFRGITKDKKVIHVEAYGSRTILSGSPAVVGTLIDITERMRAEKEREQYFNLFQNSRDLMVIADPKGTFKRTNPACSETLGYTETELVSRPFLEFVHPDDRQRTVDEMERQLKRGFSFDFENRYLCRNGSVTWLSWRAIYDGKAGLTYATARDVTEMKRAEAALRLANTYNRNLLEVSLDPLVVVGRDGKITDVNAATEAVTGHPRTALIGSDFFSYFADPDKAKAGYKQVFQEGSVHDYALEIKHRDGHITPVQYNASVYRNEEGEVIGLFAAARDMTERRGLEEQLRQAQKMEAIGQLAGGVAHDFNNVLSTVIGYAHLAKEKMVENDPSRVYLEQILEASDKAATLTHSLLAFSRKQLITLKPVNLNELVVAFERLSKRLIGEDIMVQTVLAKEEPWVMADRGQVEQVLMNLATNARDAMNEGGVLVLTTGVRMVDEDFVKNNGYGSTGTFAFIAVSDSGTGMSAETKSKIFEPFFTTKETGKGTGLGLSMVYGIIKQHEGFINVYSEPNKGTTFRIYLPLHNQRKEVAEIPPVESVIRGGHETVLVAEDDIQLRKLARAVLKDYGYNVILAEDGEDAVEKFIDNRETIELLLLDMIMPKKGGKKAYEEIKKMRDDIKVLFTTGYTADSFSRESLSEDGLDFVLKPVSPKDLLMKVREVLDKK